MRTNQDYFLPSWLKARESVIYTWYDTIFDIICICSATDKTMEAWHESILPDLDSGLITMFPPCRHRKLPFNAQCTMEIIPSARKLYIHIPQQWSKRSKEYLWISSGCIGYFISRYPASGSWSCIPYTFPICNLIWRAWSGIAWKDGQGGGHQQLNLLASLAPFTGPARPSLIWSVPVYQAYWRCLQPH